jgi:type IV pilus assembly protein PilN
MIKINLVGEGRKPVVARTAARQRKVPKLVAGEQTAFILLITGLVLMLGVFAVWYLRLNGTIKENDVRIADSRRRVEELREIIRQVEEFEAKEAELKHKIEVITNLKNSQRGPVELMDEVSQSLPDLLWLDRLQQQGDVVTITGRAFNITAISSLIENLDRMPTISEPELRDATQNVDSEIWTFTIVFNKTAPKAPEVEEELAAA